MEGPLVLCLGSKVAAKYSVLLVELRALALAVLAVQVCAAEGLACKFCSFLVSIASLQTLAKPER